MRYGVGTGPVEVCVAKNNWLQLQPFEWRQGGSPVDTRSLRNL
jgi:hypothetical protein